MTPNPQDSAVALEVELLPCPFCGGAGEAFDVHTLTWHVRYGCQSCQVFFNDAETWNRRASQSDGTSGGWHTCEESSECAACDDLRASAAFAMGYLSNTMAGALGEREWGLAEPKIRDVLRFIEQCATASKMEVAQCPNCKGTRTPNPLDPDWQGRCECAATYAAIAARKPKTKADFSIDDAMEAIRLIVGEDTDVLLSDQGEGRVYSVLEQISPAAPNQGENHVG